MGVEYQAYLLPRRRSLVPTSAQVATFVEELRASKWTHACFYRPAAKAYLTVPRGDRQGREVVLPDPLTPEGVEDLRRASAPHAVDDELRIVFQIFWSNECVPNHVLAEVDEAELVENEDELRARRVLMVEDEHPRYYQVEILVARDLVETWGNNVDLAAETRCRCGELLSYDASVDRWPALVGQHIRAVCPACSQRHDPATDPPTLVTIDSGYERAPADVAPKMIEHTHLASHLAVVLDFDKDRPVLPGGSYLTVDPDLVGLCERAFGEPFEVVNVFT